MHTAADSNGSLDDDELGTLAMWGFEQSSCMRCHKTNKDLDGYEPPMALYSLLVCTLLCLST